MKFLPIIFTTTALLSFTACSIFKKNSKENKDNNTITTEMNIKDECPDDLICTMDFRAIEVNVENANKNQPIDMAKLHFPEAMQNKVKMCTINFIGEQCKVIIADDSEMGHFKKEGVKVNLILYSKGNAVATHEYVIGHDCCHIKLIKGENLIKIK